MTRNYSHGLTVVEGDVKQAKWEDSRKLLSKLCMEVHICL